MLMMNSYRDQLQLSALTDSTMPAVAQNSANSLASAPALACTKLERRELARVVVAVSEIRNNFSKEARDSSRNLDRDKLDERCLREGHQAGFHQRNKRQRPEERDKDRFKFAS